MNEQATGKVVADKERRNFLTDVTIGFGFAGAACAAWPFIKSMSPAADVVAEKTADIDISDVSSGTFKVVLWQGKPVFIRHRTKAEINRAREEDRSSGLLDPQKDEERVQRPEWLITMAICTHLGCVPIAGGDHGAWICPCHGSQYDLSGRVRRPPAPKNLEIPPYAFLSNAVVRIG